jgi:hypothetical protein
MKVSEMACPNSNPHHTQTRRGEVMRRSRMRCPSWGTDGRGTGTTQRCPIARLEEEGRRGQANSTNRYEAQPTPPVARVAMPKGRDLGAQNNKAAIQSIETPGHVLRPLE